MTKWRMRIAYWINKAIHTHTHTLRIYNNYSFSIATMFGRTGRFTDDKMAHAHCILDK